MGHWGTLLNQIVFKRRFVNIVLIGRLDGCGYFLPTKFHGSLMIFTEEIGRGCLYVDAFMKPFLFVFISLVYIFLFYSVLETKYLE